MSRLLRPYVLIVVGGFVLGLAAGVFVFETDPPFFGWLFGAGAGITGGAFIAAIASGQQIVSGPAPPGGGQRRRPAYTSEELDELERELPHLLDDLPPPQGGDGRREE